MNNFIKAIISALIICASAVALNAEIAARAEIVIFPAYTGNSVADVILKTTADRIEEACRASGRFLPAEYNSRQFSFSIADGKNGYELYKNAAAALMVDACTIITLYQEGTGFRAVVDFVPVSDAFKDKGFSFAVSANIAENIPLKAAKEFALRLKDFPVTAKVLEKKGEGRFLISAGQWHGLREESYDSSCGRVKIHDIGRYTAVAECAGPADGSRLVIDLYPDNDRFISMLDSQVIENTVRRYGTDGILQKRKGSGQELIIATCLVNQGASFCLPGYGSFLSVEYLGIENGSPDKTAVGVTAFLAASHLLMPSALTEFEINFFPWNRDSDKTGDMQRLQYFLWATLPVTFSVSYYSQLAYQYSSRNLLPPLFENYNTTAVMLSLFIPGGGLFYKGYRGAGWTFYAGEMGLAGCAVYMYGRPAGRWCFAGLAALKAADMFAAWIFTPSYEAFRREVAASDRTLEFGAAFVPDAEGKGEFLVSVTKIF